MSVQLSTEQLDAVTGISKLFTDAGPNRHAIAVLTGSAGTGKTTIITKLLEEMSMHGEVLLAATTHRAGGVLEEIVNDKVTTAHNLFQLKPSVSKYGKEYLERTGRLTIRNNSVLIIDEASMIGNQLSINVLTCLFNS